MKQTLVLVVIAIIIGLVRGSEYSSKLSDQSQLEPREYPEQPLLFGRRGLNPNMNSLFFGKRGRNPDENSLFFGKKRTTVVDAASVRNLRKACYVLMTYFDESQSQ